MNKTPLHDEVAPPHFELTVEFLSDWHIGEGAGRSGQIDRIVKRHPQDKLPYIPGKTLTGMWRDACEKVAFGLDDGALDGRWQQLTRNVFGDAGKPALIGIGPARLTPTLRQALQANPEAAQALIYIKPGVALDEQGIARDDHLRMEECCMSGAVLRAPIQLILEPNQTIHPAVLALLWAGAKVLDRMGAKRRRGLGRCHCQLLGPGNAPLYPEASTAALQQLEQTPPEQATTGADRVATSGGREQPPTAGASADKSPTPSDDWQVCTLSLELLTPVIVPARTLGNVVESRDHIPGTLLLSALSRTLQAQLGADWGTLLAAGEIQVRNAYLAQDGKRLLPVPMALFETKQKPSAQSDLNLIRKDPPPEDTTQRKQCRNGYVKADGQPRQDTSHPVHLGRVAMQSATHATIEDRLQRPSEATGGVYTYEAISAGQPLQAELWVRSTLAHRINWSALAGHHRIGRSKKDEYGQVRLSVSPGAAPHTAPAAPQGDDFTLWLTAPLLLRDDRLRPSTDIHTLQAQLQKALGVEQLSIDRAQRRVHREDGWQTTWHTHRPSRLGFAAGSCFLVKVSHPNTNWHHKLATLQANGLGERRAEGYGEIRIEAPLLREHKVKVMPLPKELDQDTPQTQAAAIHSEQDASFLHAVLSRHWQLSLERSILRQAKRVEFRKALIGEHTNSSQLGNLRSQLEAANDEQGLDNLRQWLNHQVGKKFSPAHKNMQELLTDPQCIWKHLPAPAVDDTHAPGFVTGHKQRTAPQALRLAMLAATLEAQNGLGQPQGH